MCDFIILPNLAVLKGGSAKETVLELACPGLELFLHYHVKPNKCTMSALTWVALNVPWFLEKTHLVQ